MSPNVYNEPAALQAQAIASRSLVHYYINNPPEDGYPEDDPFNNSSKYQVFIPYQFDRLALQEQHLITEAVASGHYIAYAIDNPDALAMKALFAADMKAHTADGTFDKPYLVRVPEPISTACDADNEAVNQYGMSQQGANRWARGHECSYVGAPVITTTGNISGTQWSVAWPHTEYILTHYYTNIHLHNQTGTRLTPKYRWVPLQVDWHTADNQIPIMEHGTGYSVTFQVQNTGVVTWTGTGQIALIYHGWNVAGTAQSDPSSKIYAGLTITSSVAPGAVATDTITLYPPVPPQPGTAYQLRFEMGAWEQTLEDWVGFNELEPGYPWPTYDISVYVRSTRSQSVFLPLLNRTGATTQ